MARTTKRLNANEISRLGPGRYHDGDGLYLLVGKGTARSWVFRYMRRGRAHDYGLGPVRRIGLAEARQGARDMHTRIFNGDDPAEARRTERRERTAAAVKVLTFAEAAELCVDEYSTNRNWKRGSTSEQQWRQSLAAHAYPRIGGLAVSAIDTQDVLKVLNHDKFWKNNPETADRVRGRIEAVLAWATRRGHRPPGDNPARWRDHLDQDMHKGAKTKRKHFAALPFEELGELMVELRRVDSTAARALEFLILTATRTKEARLARWSEINQAERVWTVPAERMKAGRKHQVPLSDAAMRILEALPRINDYVFPGRNGPVGPAEPRRVLAKFRTETEATVHGFRATFSTWASETTSHVQAVVEMALAHTISNAVEAAYRRGELLEKRRALMQDWAAYSAAQPRPRPRLVA